MRENLPNLVTLFLTRLHKRVSKLSMGRPKAYFSPTTGDSPMKPEAKFVDTKVGLFHPTSEMT
jgi:hypothetical protein